MDMSVTRRAMLRNVGLAAGALTVWGCQVEGQPVESSLAGPAKAFDGGRKPYELPPLPYAYDALEPYIDAQTLRLHHDKHHAGYVKGLNAALARMGEAEQADDFKMVKYWARDVAFNGAGHVLHCLYWTNMTPNGGGAPVGPVAARIVAEFGSVDRFAQTFAAVTVGVPGSGWGVLAYEPLGRRLIVTGVEKHENVDVTGSVPLLVCDVWEHAYYLKYQNRRKDYVEAFCKHLVNWDSVNRRLAAAIGER